MSPSRSVTRSTCQPCSGPTTRQAPNAPDSSKAKPPVARAIALAASRGSPVERDVDVVGGPAEQPVAHGAADEPRLTAGQRLARAALRAAPAHRVLPRHARGDPARDLVVDGAEPPGDLLGQDPLAAAGADQDGLGAARHRLVAEVDGDVVHRDGPDQRHAAAVDQHVGVVGQRAADAVAVPDRQRAEPRLALGHEPAPVAGALAGPRALDLGDVADQLQRRLEPVVGGVAVERVHAVDGDPAAHQVEPRGRLAQRGGRVGGVHGHAGRGGRPTPERGGAAPRGRPGRPRRRWRSASSAPAMPVARRAATTREASSASRVPSRPIPCRA